MRILVIALWVVLPLMLAACPDGFWCEGQAPTCCDGCFGQQAQAASCSGGEWTCPANRVSEEACLSTGYPFCQGPQSGCPHERPSCCVGGCVGAQLAYSRCEDDQWTCPSGAATVATCEAAGEPFCPGHSCTPQDAYSYDGCEEGPQEFCPRRGRLRCALETLAESHGSCELAEDCVVVRLDERCSGLGYCPGYSVNVAQEVSFAAEAQAEVDRYCSCGGCSQSAICGIDLASVRPACEQGLCGWTRRGPDGCIRQGDRCEDEDPCCAGLFCGEPDGDGVRVCEADPCRTIGESCSSVNPCCSALACEEVGTGDPCAEGATCACVYLLD